MKLEELATELRQIADIVSKRIEPARWYLFGSALKNPSKAADIDVLVICKSDENADEIRKIVSAIELYRPIHLSILTEEEEVEINFVTKQGCAQIF